MQKANLFRTCPFALLLILPGLIAGTGLSGCTKTQPQEVQLRIGLDSEVEGLKVIDPSTFQITLLKPEPFFLNRLSTAWVAIFPKESAEARYKDKWGIQMVVGTGPYRLASRSENEFVLVRNDEYWDKARSP